MWRIRWGRVEAGRIENQWSPDFWRSHSLMGKQMCPQVLRVLSARRCKEDSAEECQRVMGTPGSWISTRPGDSGMTPERNHILDASWRQGFFQWRKTEQALLTEGAVDAKEWQGKENVSYLKDTKQLGMAGCLGLRWPWQTLESLTWLWLYRIGNGLGTTRILSREINNDICDMWLFLPPLKHRIWSTQRWIQILARIGSTWEIIGKFLISLSLGFLVYKVRKVVSTSGELWRLEF